MKTEPRLDKGSMMLLSSLVRRYMDSNTLRKGLKYWLEHRVKDMTENYREIKATVRGGLEYNVTLDLTRFGASSCSCPNQVHCKHIAAVFFELYSDYEEPSSFLSDKVEFSKNRGFFNSNAGKASVGQDDPDNWEVFYEQTFNDIQAVIQGYGYYNPYHRFELFNKFVKVCEERIADWPETDKLLFLLHGEIYLLAKIEKKIWEEGSSASILLNHSNRRLMEIINNLSGRDLSSREQVLEKINLELRQRLFMIVSKPAVDWLLIYQWLWFKIFPFYLSLEDEIAFLEKLELEPSQSKMANYHLIWARVYFALSRKDDGTARDYILKLNEQHLPLDSGKVVLFFYYFDQDHDYQRVWDWLTFLSQAEAEKTDNRVQEQMLELWERAAYNLGKEEEYLNVLRERLPYSSVRYLAYLLESNRHVEWIEYHLARGTELEYLAYEGLKEVSLASPGMVLPLYHQQVVDLVEQKNRQAYKAAVKNLKKLRTLYKKIKQVDRWHDFIMQFSQSHNRLRALQEELIKGKLIEP